MLLLSKSYVNLNAAKSFMLNRDLNLEFLIAVCFMNTQLFKKVAVVKDFISPIIDYVNVNEGNDWRQLEILGKYLDSNIKMLIQGNLKLKKMREAVERRVQKLK